VTTLDIGDYSTDLGYSDPPPPEPPSLKLRRATGYGVVNPPPPTPCFGVTRRPRKTGEPRRAKDRDQKSEA